MRLLIPLILIHAFAFPARTAEPPGDGAVLYRGFKLMIAIAKDLEFTRMLTHILEKGADMGPGDGWFKPGESRYGWKQGQQVSRQFIARDREKYEPPGKPGEQKRRRAILIYSPLKEQ